MLNVEWPVVTGDDETLVIEFLGYEFDEDRTWRAQVRQQRAVDAPLLAEVDVEGSAGAEDRQVVQLNLTAAQTRGFPSRAYWDLQLTDGGIVTTIAGGLVETVRDVTA